MNPSSELSEPTPAPSATQTDGLYRLLKRVLAVLACAWGLLVLAWLSLHLFIVPRIDDYRPWLQRQASQALGVRVEIGKDRKSVV